MSAAVFWYLDGQALDWLGQTGRGRGVQVTEVRGDQVIIVFRLLSQPRSQIYICITNFQLVSTLKIERADMHHAGKFTCAPSYAKPDTVIVHVIDGKFRLITKNTEELH
jgi:hypothetical protein